LTHRLIQIARRSPADAEDFRLAFLGLVNTCGVRVKVMGQLFRRRRREAATLGSLALMIALQQSPRADDATDLLFFSSDLIGGRGYAGAGWMHAFSGLDANGVIFSLEGGRPEGVAAYGAAQVGWRFVESGIYLTFMGGLDAEPRLRPLVSADVWWEPAPGWMTQGRFEAATGWVSWRAALGWRASEAWPWIGPEAASSAELPRVGLHATGLKLSGGFEARVSAGASWGQGRAGPYCEISVWRRF
jgi:hypothetical protein